MAFEDLTDNQRRLVEDLVQSLRTEKYRSEFIADWTGDRG